MRALLAQLKAEVVLTLRRGENALVTVVIPMVLLVFFGEVMPLSGGARQDHLDFLVPGILALAVMSTSFVSLGISTAYERHYGVLKRLIGSPLPRASLLLAKTGAVLLVELVQVVGILAVAVLWLGWQPHGSSVLALVALLVGSLAFASLGLLMAGALRAEATLAAANGLYLLFLLMGGFVLPRESLPRWLASPAGILPSAALADATRAAFDGSGFATAPLILLAAWTVVLASAAARTFRAD